MADEFYKQCFLRRKLRSNPETFSHQVAWIPEIHAHKGGFVELKGENGWEVVAVDTVRKSREQVSGMSQEYKHQRKASDI